MSLTQYVSEFIVSTQLKDIPDHVVEAAKRSIIDGLGLAVAGATSSGARIARAHVAAMGCSPTSTVLGNDMRTAPRFAAFLNGLSIHADDYDDTQLASDSTRVYGLLTHPTAPVLPAALAIAEQRGLGGADFVLSYLVGVEVETKVSDAIQPRHYEDGFHSTGTVGTIGAGAAVARLIGLGRDATSMCLGLAASQSAGLRENFGTMTKPFHAGRAAEAGVVAADFAARGFTAATTILEADRGFFRAAGGGYRRELIEGRLGKPWTFQSPGVSIKPHPSGSLTHPGMAAFANLVRRHRLRVEQIARIVVGTNRHVPTALIHHRPTTALEAKFSLEFCLAILLVDGQAGLAQFTDAVVRRPDIQDLIRKTAVGVSQEADAAGYATMATIIDVHLTDGRVLRTSAGFAKGSPQNPMSEAELLDKFRSCLAWGGLPSELAEPLTSRLLRIEDERSLSELLALLRPSHRALAANTTA
jgi:2-methylcitrate dehydratase PrpD